MFYLKSYVKHPKRDIYSLEAVQKNPSHFFISIEDLAGMASIKDMIDLNYLDGVIVIEYDGRTILDFTMWDLIDQLWEYLIRMTEDVLKSGYAETYFPDQAIKLEMKRISKNSVQFCVTVKKKVEFIFTFKEFASALLVGGEQFFTSIIKSFDVPSNYYQVELQKIDELRKKINLL